MPGLPDHLGPRLCARSQPRSRSRPRTLRGLLASRGAVPTHHDWAQLLPGPRALPGSSATKAGLTGGRPPPGAVRLLASSGRVPRQGRGFCLAFGPSAPGSADRPFPLPGTLPDRRGGPPTLGPLR
ncbi:hypothetical protein NDU88_004172 [Pleurodeles waltl]|uniref:Uncharacterized protein n=1 Tax=Pleurodeles waltl TaxID=8319 RepID=A0AAV7LJ55_PLEWA|nr:hypothetical protein NDU88_004172 [Pleurodeles waltl]